MSFAIDNLKRSGDGPDLPASVVRQAEQFIAYNRNVLREYVRCEIDTADFLDRLYKVMP